MNCAQKSLVIVNDLYSDMNHLYLYRSKYFKDNNYKIYFEYPKNYNIYITLNK